MSLQKENRENRFLSPRILELYPKKKEKERVFFFFSVNFCISLHLHHSMCIYIHLLFANDTRFLAEIFDYNINHWCSTIQMAPYIFYICICSISVLITRKNGVIKAVKKLQGKKMSKERCCFLSQRKYKD